MPFWQRLLALVLAILVVSFLVDWLWHSVFGFELTSYLTGIISGLAAVPLWAMLKRIKPKPV